MLDLLLYAVIELSAHHHCCQHAEPTVLHEAAAAEFHPYANFDGPCYIRGDKPMISLFIIAGQNCFTILDDRDNQGNPYLNFMQDCN